MTSKFLVALAVLFIVSSACVCVTFASELMEVVSNLSVVGAELRDAFVDTRQTEEETAESNQTGEARSEPEVYTCDYINRQRKEMTKLQWEHYTEILVGRRIVFEGEVKEVYDDGRIRIDACSGFLSGEHIILYGTPLEVAIELSKGQIVSGEGTIKEVGVLVFMFIHVDGDTIE